MRANKIIFTKVKSQFEILKIRASVILAMEDMEFMSHDRVAHDDMTPEEFHRFELESFNVKKTYTPEEKIRAQMKELEDQGARLLEEENYESLELIKKTWELLNKRLNK